MSAAYGYDGCEIRVGARVELHPATDLWMRGARYGTVERMSLTPNDRVKVRLDRTGRLHSGPAELFRTIDYGYARGDVRGEGS